LTRTQADEVGIYLPLEGQQIASAEFPAPPAAMPGEATGVMTLFNAARLNLRSGVAPFRSLGRWQPRAGEESGRRLRSFGWRSEAEAPGFRRSWRIADCGYLRPAEERGSTLSRPYPAPGCAGLRRRIGRSIRAAGGDSFARAGAMFTDAVARWTGLVLLRFRYRLPEETEEFAGEIVLAAFERGQNGPRWLEPYATAGRDLAERAQPRANISREERVSQVQRALAMLKKMRTGSSLSSTGGLESSTPRTGDCALC
jgi:hypothetical protein